MGRGQIVLTKAQKIEASLRKQLEQKKANVYHFEKLISDYCSLFEIQEKLKEDVKKRGIIVITVNSKGYDVEKNNPSIDAIVKVNAQMLKILGSLGISVNETILGEGEDEL